MTAICAIWMREAVALKDGEEVVEATRAEAFIGWRAVEAEATTPDRT